MTKGRIPFILYANNNSGEAKIGAEGVTRGQPRLSLRQKDGAVRFFRSRLWAAFFFGKRKKMKVFEEIIGRIDDFVWGIPLIVLILGVGIYLTVRLVFVQLRRLPRAFRYMFAKEEGEGEVSSFGALCTALSATIGTGNIVGVATAIVAGGPGALFWMWIAALFGMATKYAEGLLAVKYRKVYADGHTLGGPFYYIENGLGRRWKFLAVIFAVLGMCVGLFGIGTFSQVNSITAAVGNIFGETAPAVTLFGGQYNLAVVVAGVLLTVVVALVLLGGVRRIAKVSETVVPFMVILYVLVCIVVLFANVTAIPSAVADIVVGAFNARAVTGGAVGSFFVAMQMGIARGIFSNEAGLGSAPIAAAAAKTKEPVRQGLVSMTGTFLDTIVVCTMTGLAIVITGSWNMGLDGVDVTIAAFSEGLPGVLGAAGPVLLMVCLIFFAFTTILGWNFYGERCLEYVVGRRKAAIYAYRVAYILAVFVGPYMTVAAVWDIADIFNGLMAIPNLIALVLLSGVVVRETRSYFRRFPSARAAAEGTGDNAAPPAEETGENAAPPAEGTPGRRCGPPAGEDGGKEEETPRELRGG